MNHHCSWLRLESLNSEWRRRIASSPNAKKAYHNLEFHRRKVRKMIEELHVAEEWEKKHFKRLKMQEMARD